jgi:hypothetical protein
VCLAAVIRLESLDVFNLWPEAANKALAQGLPWYLLTPEVLQSVARSGQKSIAQGFTP